MKKITRKALLTAKLYRPGKAGGGPTKKKQYTLVPDVSRREVRAVSPTGSEVGYLSMEKYGDAAQNNEAFKMAVKPAWQRQGIMTALHDEAEKHFGTINPSRLLSDDGFAFWKSYRPDAVRNSYRFHADRIMGKPVSTSKGDGVISSIGDNVMIAKQDDGSTFLVPDEISDQMFKQAQAEAEQEQQPEDDINKADGGRTGYADGGTPSRYVDPNNFYSKAHHEARKLTQKKGSPQQMRAMLEKAGVKPEEIAQSGYDEAFAGRPSVTSDEVASHFHQKRPNLKVERFFSPEHAEYEPEIDDETRFDRFTLHGQTNYREHLLRLPPKEGEPFFTEDMHWPDYKNVVAHIRMGDRGTPIDRDAAQAVIEKMKADDGITRFIGADPSKWASGAADFALERGTINKQEAQALSRYRRWNNDAMRSYVPERNLHVEEIQSDWAQKGRKQGFAEPGAPPDQTSLPRAPFVTSTPGWTNLALKHILTEAVKGRYDRVVLSPGQANADMYSGLDEKQQNGLRSFYDQVLPTQMNKLVKSLDPDHPGMRMFSHTLPPVSGSDDTEGYKGHALDITPDLRDAVNKGLPMFKRGGEVEGEGGGDGLEVFYGPTADEHRGRWYTGTSKDKDFTAFQESRHGTWLTRDPEEASDYAMQNDSQDYKPDPSPGAKPWAMVKTNTASRVIPTVARVENPYRGEKPDWVLNTNNYKKAQSDWFDQLRSQGHDAWAPYSNKNLLVMLRNQGTNIKSAIGNSGAYDRSKKHLAKSEGGLIVDNALKLARNLKRR